MQHYDLLALGAATCWAASGLLSAAPSKALGAIAFVRWRMTTVTFVLWLLVALFSQLPPLAVDTWGVMVASGLVGIFVGDTLLFAAMNRLGPRRTGVLFASHALLSALLGYLFLSERLGVQAYIGAGVTVAGVMVAVAWGNSKTNVSEWDSAPSTVAGVSLALLAALGQATGALIAKPALGGDLGFDPVAASAVRVTAAVSALWLWRVVNPRSASARGPYSNKPPSAVGWEWVLAWACCCGLCVMAQWAVWACCQACRQCSYCPCCGGHFAAPQHQALGLAPQWPCWALRW